MAKSSFQSFLKGFDHYSKTVTLKYKKKGAFQTSCGGIASIITLGIFIAWITIEFVDVYIRDKFEIYTDIKLTQQVNGEYPTYFIQQEDLFTTFSLVNYDGDLENLDQYVTGMWL